MNFGRYKIVEQLGTGLDGIAYSAIQDETGQLCEVRDLAGARAQPRRWQKVVRHLRLASLLRHARQRQLLEMNLETQPPFIALEDESARPLSAIQSEDLPWAPSQVQQLGRELASLLRAAHRLGLVHGALKPSVIFWQPGLGAAGRFHGCSLSHAAGRPER